ncbi:MAG: peptidylprolyl isomerase [Candidatus Omnitrophota bacterium]
MISAKNGYKFLMGFTLALSLVCVGCDKLSFLGDYFPSMKKKNASGAVKTESSTTQASQGTAIGKDVLVKIDNWTLTLQEFNEKVAQLKTAMGDFDDKDIKNKQAILDELIRQQLLIKEAEQKGLDKNKDVVNAINEYRKTLVVQQLAKGLVENIQVTDKDVEDFYKDKENADLFTQPVEWHIRELVVTDEAKAKELLVSILQGADFAETARGNSISETAAQGGDAGFAANFEDPQVGNVVLTLEPGQTSSVFKGKKGYYIIKLEEQRGGDMEKLEAIKAKPEEYEQLKQYVLGMKRQGVVADYIEDLKSKTSVVVNENLLR